MSQPSNELNKDEGFDERGRMGLTVLVGIGYAFVTGLCLLCLPGLLLVAVNLAALGHVLGHLIFARLARVPLATLCIGFGPTVPGAWFVRGGTLWRVGIIPIGAYVIFSQELERGSVRRFVARAGGVVGSIFCGLATLMAVGFHGEEHPVAVVSRVAPGSPAWSIGMRSGDVISRIGDARDPNFTDLQFEVMTSTGRLPITFGAPGSAVTETAIDPVYDPIAGKQLLGVLPPLALTLPPSEDGVLHPPVALNSAAARAKPSFAFGDRIVATTDPDQPAVVAPLPANDHNPGSPNRDYFAFWERLHRLRGEPMTIQVERDGRPVDILVPPAFHWTLGLRMEMGDIVAVRPRPGLPYIGVRREGSFGDTIYAVEVLEANGKRLRWENTDNIEAADLHVLPLDPARLPFELEQWAQRRGKNDKVKLWLLRGDRRTDVELSWDDRFRFSRESPTSFHSPTSIPGLGIAYQISPIIGEVRPGSPADKAKLPSAALLYPLKPGDRITAIQQFDCDADGVPTEPKLQAHRLSPDGWSYVEHHLSVLEAKRFVLFVQRGGDRFTVRVDAEEDPSWPEIDRGLVSIVDTRVERASNPLSAVGLGFIRLEKTVQGYVGSFRAYLEARMAPQQFIGPVAVARVASTQTGFEFFFFQFLGLVGALHLLVAVANVLPVPGTDIWATLRSMGNSPKSTGEK